jgi:hypothetical protein
MRPSRNAARDLVGRGCIAVVTVVLASDIIPWPALAQDAKSNNRSELVLTDLPPRGSKAYKHLLGLAGKQASGQLVRYTQSEVWLMPSQRIEGVIRQGAALGVKISRLGADGTIS